MVCSAENFGHLTRTLHASEPAGFETYLASFFHRDQDACFPVPSFDLDSTYPSYASKRTMVAVKLGSLCLPLIDLRVMAGFEDGGDFVFLIFPHQHIRTGVNLWT